MSGALLAAAVVNGAQFLLTVGALGADKGFLSGVYGALAPASYRDKGGATRAVLACSWNSGAVLGFHISGGSVPNTDSTFTAITVNGVRKTRASASYITGANTAWEWPGTADPFGAAASVAVLVE